MSFKLSKLDWNWLQKFKNVTAGFVFIIYSKIMDVLELKWLMIEERTFNNIDIFVKTLHEEQFPKHL